MADRVRDAAARRPRAIAAVDVDPHPELEHVWLGAHGVLLGASRGHVSRSNDSMGAMTRPAAAIANPFLDETAGGMLAAIAARFPDREAIVAPDQRISYSRFHAEACRFARALLSIGVRRGDKVALWLPNRPAWLFAQYGSSLIGAVVVALNPRYKAHELSYILGQLDSTTLLLTDHLGPVDFLDTLREVIPSLADSDP